MKKTIFVNLNFDDFHPQADQYGDFGGDSTQGTFLKLTSLCQQFPGLVITLFTTPNWIDTPYKTNRFFYYAKEKLHLFPVVRPYQHNPFLLLKHPAWCDEVKKLVEEKKFEIAVHGYEHFNPRSRIHGQEFLGLSAEQTAAKVIAAEAVFEKAHIPFIKAFRPPGWGESIYLPNILKDRGYKIYAIESSRAKLGTIKQLDGLIHVPQNWSIRESKAEALRIAEEQGAVFMKGHLVYNYGTEIIENGITEIFWQNLIDTVQALIETYDVQFVSLEEYLYIKGY